MDTISIGKITKENNSLKNEGEATVVSARRLSCFIFLPSFVILIERYQSYRVDTISISKITKGDNSAKKCRPLLILAPRLVMLYISTKFCDIISNGIKVMERTRFLYRKLPRVIIPQKCRWSDGFDLCTSSGHALYFYQVL